MYYLFHGPDTFSRAEEISKLKARIGDPALVDLNTTMLDGQHISLTELTLACGAMPFLSERRLVIVEGLVSRLSESPEQDGKKKALSAKDKSFLQGLLEYLPNLPETTELVFAESAIVPDSHPLYKQIRADKRGMERAFPILRGRELERWIIQRARMKGAQIESGAVQELTIYVGDNLYLLDVELEKLATYVAGKRPIQVQDVHNLVSYAREENIFSLVDALGQRDGSKAMSSLRRLLEEGHESLVVLHMITRQFRLIIQAKELMEQRKTRPQMMQTLHLRHQFILDKLLLQAHNFTMARLREIYQLLQRVDIDIKSGNIEPELALDLFLADICASGG